jgi:hypothetical protein
MSAHKCEGSVWSLGWSHLCGKNAAHEHEGQWFCKTHHPPSIKAKNDARIASSVSNLNALIAESKARSEALAEQKRRADCYPDLLAALETLLNDPGQDWIRSTTWDKARAAIAKATGDLP